MKSPVSRPYPLVPLLRSYVGARLVGTDELTRVSGLGRRFRAVLAARDEFLNDTFLDRASDDEFQAALGRFYEAVTPYALHLEALQRRTGIVRHGVAHLLRCADPMAVKLARALVSDGPYHVTGLGPSFWSAMAQGLEPRRLPGWTPVVLAGLQRLGFAPLYRQGEPAFVYAALQEAHEQIRAQQPGLTALHIDHFLTLVAGMRGRDLFSGPTEPASLAVLARSGREARSLALRRAHEEVEAGLSLGDAERVLAALAGVVSTGDWRSPLPAGAANDVLIWTGRLWEADAPYEMLDAFWRADPLAGAGLWFPIAVLHVRDPAHFHPWNEAARLGFAHLEDGVECRETLAERYRLYGEGIRRLADDQQLDAGALPELLAGLQTDPVGIDQPGRWRGFCGDTFRFLAELGENNCRAWMDRQRERYQFAVRDPLVELCRALAESYIEPILHQQRGWDLETSARGGRALTSICKNDYGRSVPYQSALWITFYRRGERGRGGEAQLFVRLDAAGLSYGVCLGPQARDVGRRFCAAVTEHAAQLFAILAEKGALAECRFGKAAELAGPDDLRTWVAGDRDHLVVAKYLAADDALLGSEDLLGDILLTFDRLVPLFACALAEDPRPLLSAPAPPVGAYVEADFLRETYLDAAWLRRAQALFSLKRQLILQGVPGTGKTHVARCLAALLTGGRDDAVRLVQFHPAYSYEEFVEGIKVRSVEVAGRHDVTYPVEEGLLCTFAAEAARRPEQPHVLVIDEINRGNLPRIFGELLYLLEYREESIRLPYSRRSFRLPANLYVVGTMNAADRSVALVDQALRRRFSFLEMPPDARVLSAWLAAHPPSGGPAFAATVVALFEQLNARLRADLGPAAQVGHSYFMVPRLDDAGLRVVWEHHVLPLLEESFAGQPGRAAAYTLETLLGPRRESTPRSERRKRREAGARIFVNPP